MSSITNAPRYIAHSMAGPLGTKNHRRLIKKKRMVCDSHDVEQIEAEISQLLEENTRLCDALGFYASANKLNAVSTLLTDLGQRARTALERNKV